MSDGERPSSDSAWLLGQVGERELVVTGWVADHPRDGREVAHLLLRPSGHGAGARMRYLGQVLGLADVNEGGGPAPVAREVAHVQVDHDSDEVLLHGPAGVSRCPALGLEWVLAAQTRGQVALTVGMDPLHGGVDGPDWHAWITRTKRLRWGLLDVLP